MDFLELKKKWPKDKDLSQRTYELEMLKRVLNGTLYDCISTPFYQTMDSGGNHILLSNRRPSVRYRLSKVVVDDSVSLLFGEGRFPRFKSSDEKIQKSVEIISERTNLNGAMIDAATKGSIGSVAFLVKVVSGKIFYESLSTEYLTPTFSKENPEEVKSIQEKYKIHSSTLEEMGYIVEKGIWYWFLRIWDETSETYYLPWPVRSDKDFVPLVDEENTIIHNLGFCPIVWIRNLPNGPNNVDGACTFIDAIDTNIELDYQMSQCGRGLKYSSEPMLMIRNASMGSNRELIGEGHIIEVDDGGDAKHVEISGEACKAVLDYAKNLREIVLENIHGSRASPEKSYAVQSGKAMEMLNLPLVWLSDKLRISYGEFGLLAILRMILKISKIIEIQINGEKISIDDENYDLAIVWPSWFPSTSQDRYQDANSMSVLAHNEILSKKTLTTLAAKEYDISNVPAELLEIEKESKEKEEKEEAEKGESKEREGSKESD